MTNTLLYADDHLHCILQPGERTDRLVVTFGEMAMRPHPDRRIWAGIPLAKLGYPAIGLIGTRQNWYPRASVERALEAAAPHLAGFSSRLGYGYSMGAFAALKYARDFGLDAAIAFSPQYSINPDHVEDRRFTGFFDPVLNTDMEISPGDGAALNIVACDPQDKGDRESADLIAARISVQPVSLEHLGHGSVRCVTRTDIVGRMIAAAFEERAEDCVREIRAARRRGTTRPLTLAHKNAVKRPRTAFAIYETYRETIHPAHRAPLLFKLRKTAVAERCYAEMLALEPGQADNPGFLAILAHFLEDLGRPDEALDTIRKARALQDNPNYDYFERRLLASS